MLGVLHGYSGEYGGQGWPSSGGGVRAMEGMYRNALRPLGEYVVGFSG